MSTDSPTSPLHQYRSALDRGCHRYHLGGIGVWRGVKAVSQLLVIGFAFWGAVAGELDPSVAFAGMMLAYLGAEGIETILASAGENGITVTLDGDADDEDAETDGGARVTETPTAGTREWED